jgi:hypothetical protein
VRTYNLGTTFKDNKKVLNENLCKVDDAISRIFKATGLNIIDIIEESKHYLTMSDHIKRTVSGHISARDDEGMQ